MSDGRPSIWRLIAEDRSTQREGLLAQGFWALAVYRLSHPRLRRRPGLIRTLWGGVGLIATKCIECFCGISIPESATIGRRLRIEHFGGVIVHSCTVIGNDCLLRQNVTLGNRSEAKPMEAPVLGDRVQIGAGAVVLGNVRIGDDAIIGANAVVLRDVPAGAVAVGNPARLIRGSAE